MAERHEPPGKQQAAADAPPAYPRLYAARAVQNLLNAENSLTRALDNAAMSDDTQLYAAIRQIRESVYQTVNGLMRP